MANRAKSLSSRAKRLKACRETEAMKEDWISELPNEMITYILSLLTMKEAGQTSILSKRWKYVWAYIPILNFDGSDTMYKISSEETSLEVEKRRYLRWVNQVVGSHKGPTVDEFRVKFDLGVTSRYSIDNWVKFAMEKRVKRLELDLLENDGGIRYKCYTFRGLPTCNSLTSLKLVSVNVSGEVLANFLKGCPKLESLTVHDSKSLVNLEVGGATLKLKHLEICYCFQIKRMEINAPHLVSFKYFGPEIKMPYERSPKLAKLHVGGDCNNHLIDKLSNITSSLFQLEALTLEFPSAIKYYDKFIDQFPLFTMLEQLELNVDPAYDEDLFCFAPLIKACPFLHKFSLTFTWPDRRVEREYQKIEPCPHLHLKTVEVLGFIGHAIDLEFIMYLMESCLALENITIDPRSPFCIGEPWEFEVTERKTTARKEAEKLRSKLKPGTNLIIA